MEEERRLLEHVKAEMHLHATYAKAAELSKQVVSPASLFGRREFSVGVSIIEMRFCV